MLTIAKFGGNTLGINGSNIPLVLSRIKEMLNDGRVVAVFSAPFTEYGKARSLTDIAIEIGKRYASSEPVDIDVLSSVYEYVASRYMDEDNRKAFLSRLKGFNKQVIIALKQAAEYKRFVDVTRAKVLAYSGELVMANAMHHILSSNGIDSSYVEFSDWPIITDDNYEAANFMLDASKNASRVLHDMLNSSEVVCIGGFIGKTPDGLETTYERGGSDRTAADVAVLLYDRYGKDMLLSFEKDSSVLSADPKIVRDGLEHIRVLSYNEAKLAGMFGMKILDPIAIKDIEDASVDVKIRITNINDAGDYTEIVKRPVDYSTNPIKIVTGKKRCCIVRMGSESAWHFKAHLLRYRRYNEFVQLSPYMRDDREYSRILFLDSEFIKRYERYLKAYDNSAEIVYGRGVITLIGDEMHRVPNVASMASSTLGEQSINIINMDAQEETSRIIIVVEDKDENVENAIRAIHSKRSVYAGATTY